MTTAALPLCVYHSSDLDGKCSAAIVYHFLKGDVELYGIDYGQSFDWSMIKDRPAVFLVDFTLEPFSEMLRLHRECPLHWLDHHKSAIEELEKAKAADPTLEIMGLQKVGPAGCELTWEYVFTKRPAPEAVRLLGRYDVWDMKCKEFSWENELLPFQYGMRNRDTEPEAPIWAELLLPNYPTDVSIEDVQEEGKIILSWERRQKKMYAEARAFPAMLGDYSVLACNKGLDNSQLFDAVWDPKQYHFMLAFCLRPDGKFKISVYTTRGDVDLSHIAKHYGGGGHAKAAGWVSTDLPLTLLKAPGAPRLECKLIYED